MIDWLSWPLAQHVETWVIALLKGLAAVQKFTILIDVTLMKIELVCWKRIKLKERRSFFLTAMRMHAFVCITAYGLIVLHKRRKLASNCM